MDLRDARDVSGKPIGVKIVCEERGGAASCRGLDLLYLNRPLDRRRQSVPVRAEGELSLRLRDAGSQPISHLQRFANGKRDASGESDRDGVPNL